MVIGRTYYRVDHIDRRTLIIFFFKKKGDISMAPWISGTLPPSPLKKRTLLWVSGSRAQRIRVRSKVRVLTVLNNNAGWNLPQSCYHLLKKWQWHCKLNVSTPAFWLWIYDRSLQRVINRTNNLLWVVEVLWVSVVLHRQHGGSTIELDRSARELRPIYIGGE
jgi:hypothetical protein